MLTPSFDVCQDDVFVSITIRVPYVKISEAEIHFEGCEFRFYCKPYFLHLHLPGELSDDGCEKLSYNVEDGTVVVKLPKREHGQNFSNLGMLTTLLPRKPVDIRKAGVKPLIEVVEREGEEVSTADEAGVHKEVEEEEDFDWHVEQTISSANEPELVTGLVPYGFAQRHHGVFLKLQDAFPSIVDCPDPDHMTSRERRLARLAHEEVSFNQDHYLADLMDNNFIHTLLTFEPPWVSMLAKWREMSSSSSLTAVKVCQEMEPGADIIPFTSSQRDRLKDLPNREYLLDKREKRCLYLGLVDLIFAFAYQHRTTEGDSNVESPWTICKLSSTLCWLEEFYGTVQEVVHCCIRRTLCYPLYRHWQLSQTVLQDTRDLFRLGRRQLLACLLESIAVLNSSDPYYLLNNLYLTDYTIWLQRASAKQIQRLADELDEVKIKPESLGWDLVELEQAALMAVKESEEEGGDIKEDNHGDAVPQEEEGELVELQATNLTCKHPLIEELGDTQNMNNTITSETISGRKPTLSSSESGTSSGSEMTSSTSESGISSGSEMTSNTSESGTRASNGIETLGETDFASKTSRS